MNETKQYKTTGAGFDLHQHQDSRPNIGPDETFAVSRSFSAEMVGHAHFVVTLLIISASVRRFTSSPINVFKENDHGMSEKVNERMALDPGLSLQKNQEALSEEEGWPEEDIPKIRRKRFFLDSNGFLNLGALFVVDTLGTGFRPQNFVLFKVTVSIKEWAIFMGVL